MNVAEEQGLVVGLHRGHDVGGVGRQRVGRQRQDHAADLGVGCRLVRDPGRQRAGHQLVVDRLVQIGRRQLLLGSVDRSAHEWLVQHRVDLVEGQPVLHLRTVSVEQDPYVALVEPDEVSADPAVVLLCERQRRLVVGDRHQRLDAVPGELVEHGVVEGQALLIGCLVVTVGKDPAPGDREAEYREAHLGQERDVLGIAVVEVDPDELEVVGGRPRRPGADDAPGHHVLDRQALATLVVGTLQLVRGGGAAPEEAARKRACHGARRGPAPRRAGRASPPRTGRR